MSDKHIYTIWSDGGARGNPGPAGIGFLVKDKKNSIIKEYCEYLGSATNNVAEYMALIRSLEFAKNIGQVDKLDIFLDSELVVKQIKGEYKVKNEGLRPLYTRVMVLLSGFKYTICHIDRSRNKEADKLANKAIDEKVQDIAQVTAQNDHRPDMAQGKLF